VTEQLFDSVLNLNFKGPFRLASQVARRMADGEGGSIINVSSTAAVMAIPNVVPYGAAKAALNSMSVSLAKEFAPKVRVNTLMPGPFLTDIADAWDPKKREKATNAIRRPGKPEEIVVAALALASPSSSYTTGAVFQVDGGMRG
jgi:NAD(P)-dependent dehydrogenase (short-subunit alcohol dehydrogenase family)